MLRRYQQDAIDGIIGSHRKGSRPLVVMATGTGKTHVFMEYARRTNKRVMIVAERSEIVMQARDKLRSVGEDVDVEMSNAWSDEGLHPPRFVCASIQTLNANWRAKYSQSLKKQRRLERFNWSDFGLLVIDEAHHAVSTSYRRLIDHAYQQNPDIKLLGVTATPDRLDKKSMVRVFDDVPFRYEMPTAIKDGYLVPIKQKFVRVNSMDFSDVKTRGTDLDITQLDAVMRYEKNLHGVVTPTMDLAGDRPTLVFASSIKHAERMTEIFNRHRANCARVVHGKTDPDQRLMDLRDFRRGEYQFLINVQIATEGWDCPPVACVAVARPTKSRALYTQMVGRGTRTTVPLKGVTPDDRQAEIAGSSKPDCLVLDFVGNSGEHQLICTIDILAPEATPELREYVRRKVEEKQEEGAEVEYDEVAALLAEERERMNRRLVTAKVTYEATNIEPFTVLGIKPKPLSKWSNTRALSEKQQSVLIRAGIDPNKLAVHEQNQVLQQIFKRQRKGMATIKQMALLTQMGMEQGKVKRMSFNEASGEIQRLKDEARRAI